MIESMMLDWIVLRSAVHKNVKEYCRPLVQYPPPKKNQKNHCLNQPDVLPLITTYTDLSVCVFGITSFVWKTSVQVPSTLKSFGSTSKHWVFRLRGSPNYVTNRHIGRNISPNSFRNKRHVTDFPLGTMEQYRDAAGCDTVWALCLADCI